MHMLSLLLPPVCVACRRLLRRDYDFALCSLCAPEQPPLPVEQRRIAGVDALYPFDGPLANAIARLKFSGDFALAGPLGRLLGTAPLLAEHRWDLVVPVPMHPLRAWGRGFNQSVLLARWMLRDLRRRTRLPIPRLAGAILRRTRSTPPQQSLPADERARNLVGAFALHPRAALAGRSVLVIDDVTTTGATMLACCEPLLAGGARRVAGLALLRALPSTSP